MCFISLVPARHMQISSEAIFSRYQNGSINVHHRLPLAFTGARPYHQAYEHGVKTIGTTSHYATADHDMGSIIE